MKVPKEAQKLSRSLFRASFTNGRLDAQKVKAVTAHLIQAKPRQYQAALVNLQRLVRLELNRRHAVIESALALSPDVASKVESDLRTRYGSDITTEFKVTPELLGGLRVRLGSDVWDGSVRGRLNELESQLAKA